MTYLHCEHQKHIEGLENDTLTAWDTLREFWETCPDHELKHYYLKFKIKQNGTRIKGYL